MRFTRDDEPRSRAFELISMTDIIFLLLIFFLLSSSFVMQTGIKVNVPEVVSPEIQPKDYVAITLDSEGRVFVNEEETTWEELPQALGEMIPKVEGGVVVVIGDRDVSLGLAVRAMEAAKTSGAQRLAIAAQPSRAEKEEVR